MNNKLVRLLNRANLLPMLNVDSKISLMGKQVNIPLRKKLGFAHLQPFEPWMAPLLHELKPFFPGHLIDIGVNLGQTLIKAKAVFGDFIYTGFEPNPFCVAYAEELIRLNNWKNCSIIPVGIAQNTEVLKLNFFYRDIDDPSASIIEGFRDDQTVDHFIYIPVVNEAHLKQLLPEVKNCFVKIDVEGAELEVITGLQTWINRVKPVIIIEILPVKSASNQFRIGRQHQLQNLLAELGYSILRVGKGKLSLIELSEIEIHNDIDKCDYVLCPNDLKPEVLKHINRQ